jgi:hypothetical protein
MGELLIKIGDGANCADGDIIAAFNRRRVRSAHAQSICHVKHESPTGRRTLTSLARDFREATHQYRFERIGADRVKRIEIATGTEDVFGRESIDVGLFVRRRLRHSRHSIFGSPGSEIWYGGRQDYSHNSLDAVWSKIAEKTDLTEDRPEFCLWPMGRLDIRHFLAVRIVDFSDTEAAELVRPAYRLDDDGNRVLDDRGMPIEIAKRNITVDWRKELLDDLRVAERDALDRETPVGRDIVTDRQLRHESKEQPVQSEPSKMYNRERSGPAMRGGN